MDYERIHKPQGGGGLSPGKLRDKLLGMKKKGGGEEEIGSSLRSQGFEIDDFGGCKDVDVVTEFLKGSVSNTADLDAHGQRRLTDHSLVCPTIRSQDDPLDYDNNHERVSASSSMFEFQKSERLPQRASIAPFSKPPPSKWDDALKWISSPTSNRPTAGHGGQQRKVGSSGFLSRQSSTKVLLEVPDQRIIGLEEPDTKRIDVNQTKKEAPGQKFVNWEADAYSITDSYGKPVLMIDKTIKESAISLSQHDSSVAIHTSAVIPPLSTARSVSMRDMGTEMTPLASQEPSRTGTPVRATTPIRSPNTSRPSTPSRAAPVSSTTSPPREHVESNRELSDKEIQAKTRREIMALGTQLGKMNIAAWASKEDEDKDASTSQQIVPGDQPSKSLVEARAAAWEEAEKAKYVARFKREEMKIQAWEDHQKAKTEAEMRKVEVKVERLRGQAHDKLMNKLAAVRHKAEEKQAVAEAKRNRQAAKTEQQAEYIRKTGRIPSNFAFCNWCS